MPIPVRLLPFLSFYGSHEAIGQVVLPEVFSPSGSKNLYIDKIGRAKKIPGYAKQNAAAITTNGGATATRFRGLFPYRATSGGSVTRQVLGILDDAVNEYEAWYSEDDGVTWTFIADLGSTSSNRIPSFAQYEDEAFIANGVIAPRKWDGTTMTTAGATQSPTVTAADSGVAGDLDGSYLYKLVSVEADGTRARGSVTSDAVQVQLKKVSLSWTADANTDVVGYEVYRTTGTGRLFYFVGFVDGRTTVSYTDETADTTLLERRALQEHGDAPPEGTRHVVAHKDRMWWLGTDSEPLTGYYSDLGIPDSVGTFSFLKFADAETGTDFITGGFGNFEGMLVVFTERSIWTVSGTGAVINNVTDWGKYKSNAQAGAVSARTAVKVPAGAVWRDEQGQIQRTTQASLAYMSPYKDVRLFSGDQDQVISYPVKESLADLNYTHRGKCHAFHDTQNQHIVWFYPHDSATEPDRAVAWNYRTGVWYRWFTLPFSTVIEMDSADSAAIILAGEAETSKGGYCYQFWSGNSFDGSNIQAQWMSNTIVASLDERTDAGVTSTPGFSITKRWRWADFILQSTSGVTLTVEWFPAYSGEGATATGSRTVLPNATQESTQKKVFLNTSTGDFLHDEGIRLRISDNDTDGSWAVEAFILAYQALPGLKRRSQ